jgi:hypothetical protein
MITNKEIVEKTSTSLNELINSLGIKNDEIKQIFLEELFDIILNNPKSKNALFKEPPSNLPQ